MFSNLFSDAIFTKQGKRIRCCAAALRFGAGPGKVAPAGLVGTPGADSIVLMLTVTGRIAWAAEVRMSASRPWVALPQKPILRLARLKRPSYRA
jgi:hypothetical protein